MLGEREVSAAVGGTAYGANGDKLGTVEHFFVDDRTGAPTWVAVTTGLFGTRHSIAPAADATFTDGRLQLPVTAEALTSAPSLSGDHLSPAEEDALRQHYAASAAPVTQPEETAMQGTAQNTAQETVPVPRTDGGMTRSEEQLRVTTERVATTRARIVKYVVTENVTITVPVRREEIRIEQVPLDAADDLPEESLVPSEPADGTTTPGGGLPEVIVLHTERPVVTVEVVPLERVRLRTEVVHGTETITEQVQREQIAVDQHGVPPRTTRVDQ
jgi:stress response protein YsnF